MELTNILENQGDRICYKSALAVRQTRSKIYYIQKL